MPFENEMQKGRLFSGFPRESPGWPRLDVLDKVRILGPLGHASTSLYLAFLKEKSHKHNIEKPKPSSCLHQRQKSKTDYKMQKFFESIHLFFLTPKQKCQKANQKFWILLYFHAFKVRIIWDILKIWM